MRPREAIIISGNAPSFFPTHIHTHYLHWLLLLPTLLLVLHSLTHSLTHSFCAPYTAITPPHIPTCTPLGVCSLPPHSPPHYYPYLANHSATHSLTHSHDHTPTTRPSTTSRVTSGTSSGSTRKNCWNGTKRWIWSLARTPQWVARWWRTTSFRVCPSASSDHSCLERLCWMQGTWVSVSLCC
jgi:hypothetical protein